MDAILERFAEIDWKYATGDAQALAVFEDRIAEAGRKRALLTYSQLVRGVTFNLPNVQRPRTIDVTNWEALDRAIVGDFLGYISMRSYQRARFFASAIVVTKTDGSPGEGFHTLLKELSLIPNTKSPRALDIWADHVAKAHTWFSKH